MLIDLSSPINADQWEPDTVTHRTMSAREGAEHMKAGMKKAFDIDVDLEMFDGGEFLTNDFLTLTAHTGTHVDAPSHYGSRASYAADGRPRDIDELPLDWFVRPGFLLDLRHVEGPVATADDLRKALSVIDYEPAPYDIALLWTGAEEYVGTPRYFTDFTGLDRSGTNFLLDFGIKVIGIDTFSLDAPFGSIVQRYQAGEGREVLWPAHFTGRDREYCQIERLANLGALPRPFGFQVSCLPVKIRGAGAGWSRAVAVVPDQG